MQGVKGIVQQSSEQIEALKTKMTQLELDWRSAGLEARLDGEAVKVDNLEVTLRNRLDQQNQELINARAKLQQQIQELDVKVNRETKFLEEQDGHWRSIREQVENLQEGQKLLNGVLDRIQDNTRHLREADEDPSEVEDEGEKPVPGSSLFAGLPETTEGIRGLPTVEVQDLSEETQRKLEELQRSYEAFREQTGAPAVSASSSLPPFFTTQTEPICLPVKVPPTEPLYRARTVTPAVPIETMAESSTRPAGTVPQVTAGSSGEVGRPFTLKNLEAPGKFSGKGQPAATTWLTEMSHWIRLSKVPDADLWDVVATRMTGGALTWINAKLRAVEELGVVAWPSW